MFCREQIAQLRDKPELNIAFVVMADPPQAEDFRHRMNSPHRFICDPGQELFRRFRLGRGRPTQLLNPRVIARGLGASLKGHGVGRPVGDPWQLSGAFVLGTDGALVWEHRSVDASDSAPTDQIIRALERASSRKA